MSKLGDELIQSLKEALAHAQGDGPGVVHAPESSHGPAAGDTQAEAGSATDEAD